jgi:hypothetical protein
LPLKRRRTESDRFSRTSKRNIGPLKKPRTFIAREC